MIAAGVMMGMQVANAYFASEVTKKASKVNREIAEMNAQFAELDAYDAKLEGETQKAKYQSIVDKTLSEQQAALTSAGVDVTFGSAAEIQKETRFISELNMMEIDKRAEEQALGYRQEARGIRLQSFLGGIQASNRASSIMRQGLTSAAKTGVSGYGKWQSQRIDDMEAKDF